MFGFFFGTACLAGLIYTLRRGRWHPRHAGRGRWSWRGRMRGLFEHLDTSPGQEKVIVQAADDLTEAFEKLRDELSATRAAVARSLRGETFDSAALSELDARHEELVANLRRTLRTSLSKIHEALDPRQRRELADMLEYRWGWGYGPRGHGGGCGGWRGARSY
ncbi:periplasmic heavy metal sensor [Archangium violaceum]|uniref:Spy/CpxP family protein refolding chaperone n=1 Tax=Archangium violaceum TaxID=83451 RepID=UPI00193B51C3|nr:periplasmic heavy metal sensor [Archangium violaceum]QRK08155.1 periplasmic heavy metal sensor [Archangium violaceum]